jgi:hypothetical protein
LAKHLQHGMQLDAHGTSATSVHLI